MLEGSAIEAHEYGETTFIEDLNITKGHEVMEKYGLSNIVVHAPYIINIANTTKPETFNLGVDFLQQEIERTQSYRR